MLKGFIATKFEDEKRSNFEHRPSGSVSQRGSVSGPSTSTGPPGAGGPRGSIGGDVSAVDIAQKFVEETSSAKPTGRQEFMQKVEKVSAVSCYRLIF